jgi:predicted DCC family thiol-disulfide oxidoreductase YuxK
MEKLYVLYDPRCELCRRLKDWLLVQRSWLGLCLIPACAEKAKEMFPELRQFAAASDLAVISDEGQIYLNNNAWIMALYALEEYRGCAYQLAHPLLLPLARQAFATISRNRYTISRWLASLAPEQIARELGHVVLEPCAVEQPTISDYLR